MTLIPSTFVRSQWSHFFNSYKKIWNYVRFEIFAGLENDAKIEKIGKNISFCWKFYFFYLNLNCTCSQLSFEVYNVCVAQKLRISEFLINFLSPGTWPLRRPPEAAISTSATSIGYQILAKDLSFHMRHCLFLQNEIGRNYITFSQNGRIPPPSGYLENQKAWVFWG